MTDTSTAAAAPREELALTARQVLALRMFGLDGSFFQRQLPFAIGFTVAAAFSLTPAVPVTDPLPVLLSVVLVSLLVAGTLLLPLDRLPPAARDVVPVLEIVAVALLRMGTGGAESPFSVLTFLPVVQLAGQRGRRGPIVAIVFTVLGVVGPWFLDTETTASELARAVFVAVVVSLTAIVVNILVERALGRADAVVALSQTQERLLLQTREDAARLRAATQRLRESRDLANSVIDAVTEQAIVGTDPLGVVQVFNPGAERLLGITRLEAVAGRHVIDFHAPAELVDRYVAMHPEAAGSLLEPRSPGDGLPIGFEALLGAARTGAAEVRDWTYVRPDGRTVPVSVAVTRRAAHAGEDSGYIFVATDISQQQESSRLKDEFVSLISHELRTPLSSILGYLELTLDDQENPLSDEQREYLGVVERNANRLLALVGDLLFAAQVEAGRFSLARKPVGVGAVVAESVESLRQRAVTGGVDLRLEPLAEEVELDADRVRLGQAFDNLLSNAIKFTPPGGAVTVRLSADATAGTVTITFRDTGIGIPEAEISHLWERFFRASTATGKAVPGTGLGLPIVRAIVQAHGGTIDVRSTVGEGTTFAVALPWSPSGADDDVAVTRP